MEKPKKNHNLKRYLPILGMQFYLYAFCSTSLIAQEKTVQSNQGNNNINIQSPGSYNTNIGKVYFVSNKQVKVVRPDYATIIITVNTKSEVFKNSQRLGISFVGHPLKINLQKGAHKLFIRSEYYRGFEILCNIDVNDSLIGAENTLNFKFDIVGRTILYPILNRPGGLFGYLNYNTNELPIDFQFSFAGDFYDRLAPVEKNSRSVYIDQFENTVIDNNFIYATRFNEGGGTFVKTTAGWGIINKKGKFIVDPEEYYIDQIDEDGRYAYFKQDEKEGILNEDGRVLLKPQFQFISYGHDYSYNINFVEGMNDSTWRTDDNKVGSLYIKKYGLFNQSWQEVLPIKYDAIFYKDLFSPYTNSKNYIVRLNGKYQLLDAKGNLIKSLSFPFKNLKYLGNRLYSFEEGDYVGCVDNKLNVLIPAKYDIINLISDSLLQVDSADRSGYFNVQGKKIQPIEYDRWIKKYFKFFIVLKDKKFGLIDQNGNVALPFDYDEIQFDDDIEFDGGMRADKFGVVKKGVKYGLINSEGKLITGLNFEFAEGFLSSNHFSVVKSSGKFGIVTTKGETKFFKNNFKNVEALPFDIIRATLNDRYVYFDKDLNCKYGCSLIK